jgi:hypothetical protein
MKVMPMTPDVPAEELDRISKLANPDLDEARRILFALGQVLAASSQSTLSDKSMNLLSRTTCFPIRGPTGKRLVSCYDGCYSINDHQRYGDQFLYEIETLDFSCEDLTSLHPLFQRLESEDLYLSATVTTSTTVEKSRKNDDLTDHMRGLSYALSW